MYASLIDVFAVQVIKHMLHGTKYAFHLCPAANLHLVRNIEHHPYRFSDVTREYVIRRNVMNSHVRESPVVTIYFHPL